MFSRIMMSLAVQGLLVVMPINLSAQESAKNQAETTGLLKAPDVQAVRVQAETWLRESGQAPMTGAAKFDALWKEENLTLLDRVAGTLALGDPKAAKLLAEARDPASTAPTNSAGRFEG